MSRFALEIHYLIVKTIQYQQELTDSKNLSRSNGRKTAKNCHLHALFGHIAEIIESQKHNQRSA